MTINPPERLRTACEWLVFQAVVAPFVIGCGGMALDAWRSELGSGLSISLTAAGVSLLVGVASFVYGARQGWPDFGTGSSLWAMMLPILSFPIALGIGAWLAAATEQWGRPLLIAAGWGLAPWVFMAVVMLALVAARRER